MRRMIDRVFARYGSHATIRNGESMTEVKVFFQSTNSKSQQNMEKVYHPMGYLLGGQYVCMLPAGVSITDKSILTVAGKNYRVCRAEPIPVDESPVCQWAICTGEGSEEAWA